MIPRSTLVLLLITSFCFAQDGPPTPIRVTHGPMLGRPSTDSMSIWVRTVRSGEVRIHYGTDATKLDNSMTFRTSGPSHDYTGVGTIQGLKSDTRYHYRVDDHQLSGSFRTLPSADDYRNPKGNPDGLFNFKFEFACGNNQKGGEIVQGQPSLFLTLSTKKSETKSILRYSTVTGFMNSNVTTHLNPGLTKLGFPGWRLRQVSSSRHLLSLGFGKTIKPICTVLAT